MRKSLRPKDSPPLQGSLFDDPPLPQGSLEERSVEESKDPSGQSQNSDPSPPEDLSMANPSRAELPHEPCWIIFADGACSGNPGPGGWGSLLITPQQKVIEMGGSHSQTTNNQMELSAVIEAIKKITPELSSHSTLKEEVHIYTDSTYVIRGITQWIWGWQKNGWKTSEGKDVANANLWKQLFACTSKKKLKWHYVKGHSGIAGNERVDEIAVSFSRFQKSTLYHGNLSSYPLPILPLPTDTALPAAKSSLKKGESKKPYSYLSLIGRVAKRHTTWKECEARVKGQSGAKFKKAMSATEETELLKQWGVTLS